MKNRVRKYILPTAAILIISTLGTYVIVFRPAIHRARESAWRTNCVNNLKSLGTAIEMYTGETYYGALPIDKDGFHPEWMYEDGDGVVPDLRVFRCPSRLHIRYDGFHCDYIFNPKLSLSDSPTTVVAVCPYHKGGGRNMLFKDTHVKYYKGRGDDTEFSFDTLIPDKSNTDH